MSQTHSVHNGTAISLYKKTKFDIVLIGLTSCVSLRTDLAIAMPDEEQTQFYVIGPTTK